MRQRKLKWVDEYLATTKYLIHDGKLDFDQSKPLEIEIGCGKGAFIYKKALSNQDINYLGIDIQASVLGIATKKCETEQLENVRFGLIHAEHLLDIFGEESFNTIYLNFSDPWPKARHEKRRLTNPKFLEMYAKLLKKNGLIIFKSDNVGLFEYSKETFKNSGFRIESIEDAYQLSENEIISEYETKFRGLGQNIGRIIARKC